MVVTIQTERHSTPSHHCCHVHTVPTFTFCRWFNFYTSIKHLLTKYIILTYSCRSWVPQALIVSLFTWKWLQASVHFKKQTKQTGILSLNKPNKRKQLISPPARSMTETLTLLVGIYFLYATSLLIMKFNTTPSAPHSSSRFMNLW